MNILYLPIYLILWSISILPFKVLYWLSDFIFLILFHLIGYRKKVVYQNLKNSFPEKNEDEIQEIARKFYRHFCDFILETLKTLTISEKKLRQHILFEDRPLFEKYLKENRSVIIINGHFGNWEWGGARFAYENLHPLFVLYHPLSNSFFEKLIYRMRTQHGYGLFAMKKALRGMIENKDKVTATAFIGDQTPPRSNAYWLKFLNQETPVFLGTEKIARKFNYPVIFIAVRKLKRGLYRMEAKLLFDNPKKTSEFEITKAHTQQLEKDIRAQPELWLWSHRRWKHKREEV